jgi:glyoxylase I family protein
LMTKCSGMGRCQNGTVLERKRQKTGEDACPTLEMLIVRALGGREALKKNMQFTVEHLGLPAREPAALKDWYVNVLGAEVALDNGQTPPAYFLRLPGGPMIEIYAAGSSAKETGDNLVAGWRHLALRVAAIVPAKLELERKGVTFSDAIKPAGGGGRVLFFRDAEGNLLHLVERSKDSIFY